MLIHRPTPSVQVPQQVIAAFRAGLKRFEIPPERSVELDASDPHTAHPVYHLKLEHLVSGTGIRAANDDGWAMFAGKLEGGGNIIRGQVTRRAPDFAWRLISVGHGGRVYDHLRSSAPYYLEKLSQVEGNYSLRFLRIPSLNLDVFWLLALDSGSKDLAVPFTEKMARDKIADVRNMDNFLDELRPLAVGVAKYPRPYGA
jgi:hypothetical protein